MKIAGKPAVNWNKLRKAQQDPEENPCALHRGKENTFKNRLPGVRSGEAGRVVIGTSFISQNAPDTRRELQKLAVELETGPSKIELASKVFNNRDRIIVAEEKKKDIKKQVDLLVVALHSGPGNPRKKKKPWVGQVHRSISYILV